MAAEAEMAMQVAILATGLVSLAGSIVASRTASPTVTIASRWLRWVFIATFAAGTLRLFEWSYLPYWTLFCVSFLGWFLVETTYNWLAIKALSRSEYPLFPRYAENTRGDEWPSMPLFIRLKDTVRRLGYQKRQALVATLDEQVMVRLSVFDNGERTTRLQLLFLPHAWGNTVVCAAFHSVTRSGIHLVTDNLFLPFGGFYPGNWRVERRPLVRNFERLHQRHLARIDAQAEGLEPFELEPLQQVNADQRAIERVNRDLGFLSGVQSEENPERLTSAGRARLWQELWTLSYFGKPLRYS